MECVQYNLYCLKCSTSVEGGLRGFQVHLSSPDHAPPYVCGQGDCRQDYAHRKSLYDHIRKHHAQVQVQAAPAAVGHVVQEQAEGSVGGDDSFEPAVSEVAQEDEEMPCQAMPLPVELPSTSTKLQNAAELAVLNLRGITYMTSVAVKSVEVEAYGLMQETATYLKEKVENFLYRSEKSRKDLETLMEEFVLPDPFRHIKTKAQQISLFETKYGLIHPKEIFIGHGFDSRLHPNRPALETQQVPKTFQYVSVKTIISSVLSDTHLRNLILSEQASTDAKLRSFKDGSLFRTLPPDLQDAVRIIIYIDDLELVQALSPAAGTYKMAGIYFGIQNFPPELNALLSYIFVTALAFADDAKNNKVWEPLLKDMKDLETQGIDINVDGSPVTFKVVLIAQIGDSLAAADVLGFRRPSANLFCRLCYVKRRDMWEDGTAVGEPRTPERHSEDVLAASRSEANKTASGVDGPSMLHGFRFFETVGNSVFDIFHDLLQGVNKMEIKLALRHYICIKKYITIQELKSRIQFFDYGYPDKKNKPNANFTEDYLKNLSSYNLHQSGAQVWCLTRAFPFLLGDKVPDDDPFMGLISLLNQIMTIVFAHAISESDIVTLEQLIKEHHSLFQQTFPGRAEANANEEPVIEQPEEEEIMEDHGFEDFLEDPDDIVIPQPQEEANRNEGPAAKKRKKQPRIIRMINKHHHMLHYPDMIRKFGPLVLYWCMRYEARHFFFKLVATVCHNFKNLLKTLMDMLQLKLAADKAKPQSHLIMGKRGTKLLLVTSTFHGKLLVDFGLPDFSKVFQVFHVTYIGVDFRPELFVTAKLGSEGSHPEFAVIESIYVSEDQESVYLLIKMWKTERFEPKYCAYEVTPVDGAQTVVRQPKDLPMFRLMAKWKRYDSTKIYLAPRTVA